MKDQRYLISKVTELVKFALTLGLICFLVTKAPDQISQIIGIAGAFVLGGSKIKTALGI